MGFPTGGTGTSAPLPTGAATAARQDTGNASDVLAVGLRTASSTATAELGIDWDED